LQFSSLSLHACARDEEHHTKKREKAGFRAVLSSGDLTENSAERGFLNKLFIAVAAYGAGIGITLTNRSSAAPDSGGE